MNGATREPLVGLAERLRYAAGRLNMRQTEARPLITQAATALEEQSRRVEELTVALTAIVEGDVPRSVGKHWREDERSSKNDQCVHGVWMYGDCGGCIADFARTALSPSDTVEKGEGA